MLLAYMSTMVQNRTLDFRAHSIRIRVSRPGKHIDQPLEAIELIVPSDLVELLAEVAHRAARPADVPRLTGRHCSCSSPKCLQERRSGAFWAGVRWTPELRGYGHACELLIARSGQGQTKQRRHSVTHSAVGEMRYHPTGSRHPHQVSPSAGARPSSRRLMGAKRWVVLGAAELLAAKRTGKDVSRS